MNKIYINSFTNVWRKFEKGHGFVSKDEGVTWSRNGTSEDLIQRLSYYKIKEK